MPRIRDLNREHYWRQHHVRQRASGLSIAAYCQRESISAAAFYAWRHRLGAVSLPAVSHSPLFVPLNAAATPHRIDAAPDSPVEIRLPQQVRLRLTALPEPEWLCGIVAGLANLPHKETTP
jgi:hypothetical protein